MDTRLVRQRSFWLVMVALLLALLMLLVGWARNAAAQARAAETELRQLVRQMGLAPLTAVAPPDLALVALGEALYFETVLSGNRDASCATCHHPNFGLSDGLPLAVGTGGTGEGPARQLGAGRQFVPRNTPDVANRGLPQWQTMFWDGRIAQTPTGFTSPAGEFLPAGLDNVLAVQAMLAVTARHEMRGGMYDIAGYLLQPGEDPAMYVDAERPFIWDDRDIYGQPNELAALGNAPEQMPLIWQALMARLMALPAYPPLFAAAYPAVPLPEMDFTYAANALAAYQTAVFTFPKTPWDRYLAGERGALSLAAMQGALLFYGELGCAQCHTGSLLTDQQFHNIAAPQLGPGTSPIAPLDYGRFNVTNNPTDRFAFRTPSLRNVAQTAPYLHNGAYNTLEGVIKHHLNPVQALAAYNGRHLPHALRQTLQNEPVTQQQLLSTLSPLLPQRHTLSNRQMQQLVAFLQTLSQE